MTVVESLTIEFYLVLLIVIFSEDIKVNSFLYAVILYALLCSCK